LIKVMDLSQFPVFFPNPVGKGMGKERES